MDYWRAHKGMGAGSKRICPVCQEEFISQSRNQKLCIKLSCRDRSRLQKSAMPKVVTPTRICQRCQQPAWISHTGRPSKYCLDCKVAKLDEHEREQRAMRKRLSALRRTVKV